MGRDGCERFENKGAISERAMRDDKPPGAKPAAAPRDDVEVEHTRPPSSARPAAEGALDRFQFVEQPFGCKRAFHDRYCIREVATGTALRLAGHDLGSIEQHE